MKLMQKLSTYKKISLLLLSGILLYSSNCFSSNDINIEENLTKMQITLPKTSAPVANYVSYTVVGKLVFISGQLPMEDGKLKFAGKVGDSISEEQATQAARLCALNILAQLKAATGSLNKVKRCIKLSGFVNSTPDFTAHPKIINGASDFIVSIMGEKGKHARAAVGVSSLPLGAAVEIEAIFEIE